MLVSAAITLDIDPLSSYMVLYGYIAKSCLNSVILVHSVYICSLILLTNVRILLTLHLFLHLNAQYS